MNGFLGGQPGFINTLGNIINGVNDLENRIDILEQQTYLKIVGDYDASTNTPDITAPTMAPGEARRVTVAGTQFGISFSVTDLIVRSLDDSGYFKQDVTDAINDLVTSLSTTWSSTKISQLPSSFDASTGVGKQYPTVAAAYADGKRAIQVEALTIEVVDLIITEPTLIYVKPNQIWDTADTNRSCANTSLTLICDGRIIWTPTTTKNFMEGANGTWVRGGKIFIIDGSASTAINCKLYGALQSVASLDATEFFLPDRTGWGIDDSNALIANEFGPLIFLNLTGNAVNCDRVFISNKLQLSNVVFVGPFKSTTNLVETSGIAFIDKIRLITFGSQIFKFSIGGGLNGINFQNIGGACSANVTVASDDTILSNCNLQGGDLDIDNKTNTVLSNVKYSNLLNSNATTKLDVLTVFAAINPTVSDDLSLGYTVGNKWINSITQEEFTCIDNTASAAVWSSIGFVQQETNESLLASEVKTIYLPLNKASKSVYDIMIVVDDGISEQRMFGKIYHEKDALTGFFLSQNNFVDLGDLLEWISIDSTISFVSPLLGLTFNNLTSNPLSILIKY